MMLQQIRHNQEQLITLTMSARGTDTLSQVSGVSPTSTENKSLPNTATIVPSRPSLSKTVSNSLYSINESLFYLSTETPLSFLLCLFSIGHRLARRLRCFRLHALFMHRLPLSTAGAVLLRKGQYIKIDSEKSFAKAKALSLSRFLRSYPLIPKNSSQSRKRPAYLADNSVQYLS